QDEIICRLIAERASRGGLSARRDEGDAERVDDVIGDPDQLPRPVAFGQIPVALDKRKALVDLVACRTRRLAGGILKASFSCQTNHTGYLPSWTSCSPCLSCLSCLSLSSSSSSSSSASSSSQSRPV